MTTYEVVSSELMNILYLAHRIPYPPNKGEKIRAFHQIQGLARKHKVYLACLVDDPEDWPHVATLEKYCTAVDAVYRSRTQSLWRAALALPTSSSLSVASFFSSELAQKVTQRLHAMRFECIVVSSSTMAPYVQNIVGIPKLMDFIDIDSEKWRVYADYHAFPLSWVYRLEAKRLARYEEQVCRNSALSLFVSQAEASLFQQRVGEQSVAVVPNGVDLGYFAPVGKSKNSPAPSTLVFTGAMDYFPNVDAVEFFCREIFPHIKASLPEVKFSIVGRNPTPRVKALGLLPNVQVSGTVPDIRPYLVEADIAVAPFRIARGIPNKILEAMAMGLPVVGTATAFQGIQAEMEDGIRIADEPKKFAREVLTLLTDSQLRQHSAQKARQYVEQYHRWEDCGNCLEELLSSLTVENLVANQSPSS